VSAAPLVHLRCFPLPLLRSPVRFPRLPGPSVRREGSLSRLSIFFPRLSGSALVPFIFPTIGKSPFVNFRAVFERLALSARPRRECHSFPEVTVAGRPVVPSVNGRTCTQDRLSLLVRRTCLPRINSTALFLPAVVITASSLTSNTRPRDCPSSATCARPL